MFGEAPRSIVVGLSPTQIKRNHEKQTKKNDDNKSPETSPDKQTKGSKLRNNSSPTAWNKLRRQYLKGEGDIFQVFKKKSEFMQQVGVYVGKNSPSRLGLFKKEKILRDKIREKVQYNFFCQKGKNSKKKEEVEDEEKIVVLEEDLKIVKAKISINSEKQKKLNEKLKRVYQKKLPLLTLKRSSFKID